MPEVGTGADAGIVFLDGLQHVDRLVVAVCRAMIVDGHADVELLHEFVEAGEGVGVGVGAQGADAGGLCKLEDLAVGSGVFGEPVHAVGGNRETEIRQFFLHRVDGGGVGVERIHPRIKLDELEAQIPGMPEGLVHLVSAERIELHAEVEAAGRGRGFGPATQRRKRGNAGGSGGGGVEQRTA